jgi:hypothetical protein
MSNLDTNPQEEIDGLSIDLRIAAESLISEDFTEVLKEHPTASIKELLTAKVSASKYKIPISLALNLIKTYRQGKLPTKAAWKSKIILTSLAGAAALVFTRFGFPDMDASLLLDIMTAEGSVTLGVVAVLRTFFTRHVLK